MSISVRNLHDINGCPIAVGDRVTGMINSGIWVDGAVTGLGASRNNVIVWNENEPGASRYRVGRAYRFTKQ